MKRLLTLVSTLAVAAALSAPAFAARPQAGKKDPQTAAVTKSQSKSKGKTHAAHSKKKGTTEGKSKGQ
ncbi:MAG: hypothetical protein DMG21_15735 [Acidobacteria bacterium]|nr:MAG: hypothetical protein DMG21_15735 [Acidobacteriota bacterium]